MTDTPTPVDQTQVLKAQLQESNDMLGVSMDRASQYRAVAEALAAEQEKLADECSRLRKELSVVRETLEEANTLIGELRSQPTDLEDKQS